MGDAILKNLDAVRTGSIEDQAAEIAPLVECIRRRLERAPNYIHPDGDMEFDLSECLGDKTAYYWAVRRALVNIDKTVFRGRYAFAPYGNTCVLVRTAHQPTTLFESVKQWFSNTASFK